MTDIKDVVIPTDVTVNSPVKLFAQSEPMTPSSKISYKTSEPQTYDSVSEPPQQKRRKNRRAPKPTPDF